MGSDQVVIQSAMAKYQASTPRSRTNYERARRVLPGGTTRTTVFHDPYPLTIARGVGCRIVDLDGRERIDFLNNYTSLILGHAHPAVVEAVVRQVELGSAFAAPTELEVQLAEEICRRVPSVEMLRFVNSGTEATMNALRAARAYTGRATIAKCEGGFHGTHEYANVSTRWHGERAGDPRRPNAVADAPGIPQAVVDSVVVLPYNDAEAVAAILGERGQEIAAVIVEPVLGAGGAIPADPSFLKALRQLCDRHGIVLIFDEVISLRLAPGGAQELFGVTPDLTAMGKIIGGGYPVGAFGGRAQVMEIYDPKRPGPSVPHGGTFNGNPISAAAGLATLHHLAPPVYERLNRMGDDLRHRAQEVFRRTGVPGQVTGIGSVFNLHFTDQPVRNFRDAQTADRDRLQRVFLSLLNQGVVLAPRCMGCISTPMAEAEIDFFVAALEKALEAE